jgi:hypothetical protein
MGKVLLASDSRRTRGRAKRDFPSVVTVAGSLLSAWRASRIDPLAALRHD